MEVTFAGHGACGSSKNNQIMTWEKYRGAVRKPPACCINVPDIFIE